MTGEAPQGWRSRLSYKWLLRVLGLLGIGYEATHRPPEPSLLILYGGMIGLPEFLKKPGAE